MVSFPHCKINLGLHVVEKRNDGYHNIETCFYPVPWCDVLEIIPSHTMSFTSTGIIIPGLQEENLCLRAYHMLKKEYDLPPIALHLHKVVSMGAGLGGGSSDAAFTLKMLNQLFDIKLSTAQLKRIAAKLGSDCAYFLYDTPMHGHDRGEELSAIDVSLKGKFLVLIKPNVHVGTAQAYQSIIPAKPNQSIKEILEKENINDWKGLLVNDFEQSVFSQYPEIQEIKEKLYKSGALYSSMSGSGSSVFGIFDAPKTLKANFKTMTYWSGVL